MLIWKVGDKGTLSAIELIPQGVHENKKEYLAEQGVKKKTPALFHYLHMLTPGLQASLLFHYKSHMCTFIKRLGLSSFFSDNTPAQQEMV